MATSDSVLEISSPLSKIATRIRACAIFSIQNPHQKCAHVYNRTVASTLEAVRPYCVVIIATPTLAYSLVRVPHDSGPAMVAIPAL